MMPKAAGKKHMLILLSAGYMDAVKAYKAPSYSELEVRNSAKNIAWYASFLKSAAVKTEKQFLDKAPKAVERQPNG